MDARTRRRLRTALQGAGAAFGVACLIGLCLVFLATAAASFTAGTRVSPTVALPAPSRAKALLKITRFTIRQAVLSTLAALAVGLPAAYLVAKKRFLGARLLASLSAVSLCIPPLLVALAYVLSFGINGEVNRLLMHITGTKEAPLTFLYSFWGIVICHGFYNFPIIMRTVADAWASLPPDEHDAALLLGASRARVFRTVTVPQLLPAIASSGIIVFLYCFFSFVIVLLFGGRGTSTLEVEIYQAARSSLDFALVARLSLLESGIALAMVALYACAARHGRHSTGTASPPKTPLAGMAEHAFAAGTLALITLFFLVPLALLVAKAVPAFKTLFSRAGFYTSLKNTLVVAGCTAFFSTVCAFSFASISRMVDPHKKSGFLRTVPLVPMALSSVALGFGITLLAQKTPLRGSPALLVLAQSALTWPFALQQLRTPLEKIPHTVTEAASLLSPHPLDTVFRVLVPQSRRALFSAFAFSAAISCGDATLPLVLGIPRFDTLSLYTYRLSGAYRFNESCAAGAVLMAVSVLLFALADTVSLSGQRAKKNRNAIKSGKKPHKTARSREGDKCRL